jgi:hypothetical protein
MQGKDLLSSKTTWGAILTVVGPLLTRYFHLSPEGFDGMAEALAALGGAALVVWGRLKADQPITSVATMPLNQSTLKSIAIAMIAITMIGCQSFQAPRTPQDAVNQANIVITATAKTVADNVRAGVMTIAERDVAVAELRKYAVTVHDAQLLIATGHELDAANEVKLLNTALLALQKRVADKARTGGK